MEAIASLFLGPGTTVTHAAIVRCATTRTHLVWVGEHAKRTYSSTTRGFGKIERIKKQFEILSDPLKTLEAARLLYNFRFDETPPESFNLNQIRGKEGVTMKVTYRKLAEQFNVPWRGRLVKAPVDDVLNRLISFGNSILYGLAEAVILAHGCCPAFGILHIGHWRSLAFDLADVVKNDVVLETAFLTASLPKNQDVKFKQLLNDRLYKAKTLEFFFHLLNRILRVADGHSH